MKPLKRLGSALLLVGLMACGGGNSLPVADQDAGNHPLGRLHRTASAPHSMPRSALLNASLAAGKSAAAAALPSITAIAFLNWAEGRYPDLLPPPAQAVALTGWLVRLYTGPLYLGVRDDGNIYAYGLVTEYQVVALGTLSDYACLVAICLPPDPVGTGNFVGLSGIAAWDALPADQKARVNTTMRSFFLHQSVGGDLEDGAQAVGFKFEYADSHATSLAAGLNGGLFSSNNGDYAGKIAEFRNMALANRSGLGVAIMKFGYADIVADKLAGAQTDYLAAVNALRAQGIRVLHVTPPLVYNVPTENAPKMQMRTWMMSTFAQDTIFDLQDAESIDPATGARCERGGSWEICDAVRSTAACPSLNQGVDAPSGQGHVCFNPHAQRLAKAFLYAIYRSQL